MPQGGYRYPPLVPDDPEEIGKRLGASLGRAWDDLQARYQAVLTSANQRRRDLVLARLQELLDSTAAFQKIVQTEAAEYASRVVPGVYAAGAARASTFEPFLWTQFHVDAAAALAADSYADLLRRSQEAGRTSEAFARHVREVARDRTAFAVTGGRTAKQVGRELEERLAQRGISAATYANGAVVHMRTYTEMAVRTKTAVAHNLGGLNRWREQGVTYVECFDGSDCGWTYHGDSEAANGKIVTLEEAHSFPISHPNCRRAFGARPDLSTPQQAAEAEPTTTAEQRADQAASERRQAQAVQQRARVAQRERRQAARAARTSA